MFFQASQESHLRGVGLGEGSPHRMDTCQEELPLTQCSLGPGTSQPPGKANTTAIATLRVKLSVQGEGSQSLSCWTPEPLTAHPPHSSHSASPASPRPQTSSGRGRAQQTPPTEVSKSSLPDSLGTHPVSFLRLALSLNFVQKSTVSEARAAGGSGTGTHVDVMVRKRSCPAVSQICSFTFSPLISTVRILKSTPIVVM